MRYGRAGRWCARVRTKANRHQPQPSATERQPRHAILDSPADSPSICLCHVHSALGEIRALQGPVNPGSPRAERPSPRAVALPELRVSENRRILVQADGQPFFYLGDTVDYIVDRASELGLYIGMLPSWGRAPGTRQ